MQGGWIIPKPVKWDDITEKPPILDDKIVEWTEIENKPLTFIPVAHNHNWSEITDVPTFTPSHRWNGTSLQFTNPDGTWGTLINLQGATGTTGAKGDTGAIGPLPLHQWSGTTLRFQTSSSTWGGYVDLRGPTGAKGDTGNPGTTTWAGITDKPSTFPPTTHAHDYLGRESTGNFETTGNLISGKNSGGVALTTNDGQGNANVTFNHEYGVPEQSGNAGRIIVNTNSSTGAYFQFELKSGVTVNQSVNTIPLLVITETDVTYKGNSLLKSAGEFTQDNTGQDFILIDTQTGHDYSYYFWKDDSEDRLYLGTNKAVVHIRSDINIRQTEIKFLNTSDDEMPKSFTTTHTFIALITKGIFTLETKVQGNGFIYNQQTRVEQQELESILMLVLLDFSLIIAKKSCGFRQMKLFCTTL